MIVYLDGEEGETPRCMRPVVGYLVSAEALTGHVACLSRKFFASSREGWLTVSLPKQNCFRGLCLPLNPRALCLLSSLQVIKS